MPLLVNEHTPMMPVEFGRHESPSAQSDESVQVSPCWPRRTLGGGFEPMPPSPPAPVVSVCVQRWLKQCSPISQSAARVQLSPSPPSTGGTTVAEPALPALPAEPAVAPPLLP